MGEQLLGSIMLFAGNFAPRQWAFCDGQLLAISSNDALFSILGTTYGGDGRTTFGLPDLRGRRPIGPRHGPGLSDYRLGQRGGAEVVTLTTNQIPSHNHAAVGTVLANNADGNTNDPDGANFAVAKTTTPNATVDTSEYTNAGENVKMTANNAQVSIGNTGGSQYHINLSPFLGVNYIIATQGIYPSRS